MNENPAKSYLEARDLFYQAKTNYAHAQADLEKATIAFTVAIESMREVFTKDLQELKTEPTEISEKSFGDLLDTMPKKEITSDLITPDVVLVTPPDATHKTTEQILTEANSNVHFVIDRSHKITDDEKKIWDRKLRKKVEKYDLDIIQEQTGIKRNTIWQILKRGGYPSGSVFDALFNFFS